MLDANVVVAAYATRGLCDAVLEVCLSSHNIILSARILQEVRTALRGKIKLDDDTADEIIEFLRRRSTVDQPAEVDSTACRDLDDLHVLGLARAGEADCIVTGDNDLLTLGTFGRCRILSPRQFSDALRGRRTRRRSRDR
ncbi:MAG: putative toxin-antitoxin system toxin component, PIN family [Planctomycetota bacterium]